MFPGAYGLENKKENGRSCALFTRAFFRCNVCCVSARILPAKIDGIVKSQNKNLCENSLLRRNKRRSRGFL
jgi:hypothetical protein